MNARDKLRRALDEELRSVLTETGRAPVHQLIDTFARDYAHEMAQEICIHALSRSDRLTVEAMGVYRDAAAVIRPKEES